MKACSGNRKSIALLAIGVLEAKPARELRAHIEGCPGCRGYHAEISGLAATLRAAEPNSDIRASDRFHRRTLAALKDSERKSGMGLALGQMLSLLNWRVALPAAAMAAVMIAMLSTSMRPPSNGLVSAPATRARTALKVQGDLDPTVANYEMVANQSLEKLDELITRQGARSASPGPVFTASTFPSWAVAE